MRACPACGEASARTEIVAIPIARPQGQPGGDLIRVYVCDACGLGYTDDGTTQADLDLYYATMAKYGDLALYGEEGASTASLAAEAPWELERASVLADFIASTAPDDAAVLDVGCSTGTLIALLHERGFERVRGCDPLESAVAVARDVRGLDVQQGWVGTLDASERVDVMVFSHVLEHVLELSDAVGRIASALENGGRLVVEVPDASRFSAYVHAPYQDFNTEHVNHFSPASLSGLLAAFGLREVQLEQVMIRSGPSHPYPAIRGCWVLDASVAAKAVDPGQVAAHRDALMAYAAASEAAFELIDKRVAEGVGDRQFALWGAGQLAMKMLRRSAFPRNQLEVVVDAAPTRRGQVLDGHVVVGPGEIGKDLWPPCVVASSVFAADSITAAIDDLGIESDVIGLV